jgi:hypothetical protein
MGGEPRGELYACAASTEVTVVDPSAPGATPSSRIKPPAVGLILCTETRDLHMIADSRGEAAAWQAAFARGRKAAAAAAAAAPSAGLGSPSAAAAAAGGAAAVQAALRSLPHTVEVAGVPVVGCELRVRVAHSRLLDELCVAWFRYDGPPGAHPPLVGDVSAAAGVRVVSGATGPTYRVTDADVGSRLGCIVRPVSALASRWSLQAARAAQTRDDGAVAPPWAHLHVVPHEHNKYCDRRVRVCTAGSMHREGNALELRMRGSALAAEPAVGAAAAVPDDEAAAAAAAGVPAGFRVVWYRSDIVHSLQLGPAGAAASDAADDADLADMRVEGRAHMRAELGAPPAAATTPAARPAAGRARGAHDGGKASPLKSAPSSFGLSSPAPDSPRGGGGGGGGGGGDDGDALDDDSEAPHSGTLVADPAASVIWPHLPSTVYRRIRPRPADLVPTPPPDHAVSPTVDGVRAQVRALTCSRSALLAAAGRPSGGAAHEYPHSPLYPLCRDDIGRAIVAAVLRADCWEPDFIAPAPAPAAGAGAGAGAPATAANGRLPPAPHFTHWDGTPIDGLVSVSLPAGPVDPAPPKAREIWIAGAQHAHALLTGRAFYFGGYEGASVVSWVAITDDGATVELKPPTPCAPLPDDDGGGDAQPPADDHPRALRLREEQRGCLIKFKIQPVRSDGDEGHTEASRPTAEIAAAPDEAWPQ